MSETRDLEPVECLRLLRSGVVGRVALSTPEGPHIVPVNYAVFEDTIVIRTSTYSLLGTYGRNAMLAFEVDDVDHDRHVGWSVVARGRAWAELDAEIISAMRNIWRPHPWAAGVRNLYLRMRWENLTGRAIGSFATRDSLALTRHTLSAS